MPAEHSLLSSTHLLRFLVLLHHINIRLCWRATIILFETRAPSSCLIYHPEATSHPTQRRISPICWQIPSEKGTDDFRFRDPTQMRFLFRFLLHICTGEKVQLPSETCGLNPRYQRVDGRRQTRPHKPAPDSSGPL